jgi:hypothetical protein
MYSDSLQGFSTFKVQTPKTHAPHDKPLTFDANVPNMHFQEQPPPRGRGIKINQPWDNNISRFRAHPAPNRAVELYNTPQPTMSTSARVGLEHQALLRASRTGE